MTADERFAELGYTRTTDTKTLIKYTRGSEVISINMDFNFVFKEEFNYYGDACLRHLVFDEIKAVAKVIEEMEATK